MSVYSEVLEAFQHMNNFIFDLIDEYEAEHTKQMKWLDEVENHIEEFDRTGVFPQNGMSQDQFATQPDVARQSEIHHSKESLHTSSSSNPQTSNKRITRQMKNLVLSNGQQQHDELVNNIKVKLERTTDVLKNVLSPTTDLRIKEEMPPPQKPVVKNSRKKKNAASSIKVKSELLDGYSNERGDLNGNRDSDVQIQNATLDIVVLDESVLEQESQPIRTTRARTKAMRKDKETTDESQSETEDKTTRVVRSKRNQAKNKEIDGKVTLTETSNADIERNTPSKTRKSRSRKRNSNSEQEKSDVNNELEIKKRKVEEQFINTDTNASSNEAPVAMLDETLIINKAAVLNETIVLEKPTLSKNDIITDDEDIVDESPVELKRQKKTKTMFSSYESSPVKKRVQAFEKLGATASVDKQVKLTSSGQKSKEIPRLFGTPLMENRLRHLQTSSASKIQSNIPISSYISSSTASKAGSGFKSSTSQMEFRERELRRKQKEAEALLKKEAMILAQTEEKRKKREERELKVQQVKIAMEREKQKQLEISEKTKDEKSKQVLAEKEIKLIKQKTEAAKKRAAAAKKAANSKHNEGSKTKKFLPLYLKYETPLLPSPDCYDSDDPSSKQQIIAPFWQKRPLISEVQRAMQFVAPHRKLLFLSGARIPNLKEIFPSIEPSKLKRTSSAIWNQTEMSILENMTEEDED